MCPRPSSDGCGNGCGLKRTTATTTTVCPSSRRRLRAWRPGSTSGSPWGPAIRFWRAALREPAAAGPAWRPAGAPSRDVAHVCGTRPAASAGLLRGAARCAAGRVGHARVAADRQGLAPHLWRRARSARAPAGGDGLTAQRADGLCGAQPGGGIHIRRQQPWNAQCRRQAHRRQHAAAPPHRSLSRSIENNPLAAGRLF